MGKDIKDPWATNANLWKKILSTPKFSIKFSCRKKIGKLDIMWVMVGLPKQQHHGKIPRLFCSSFNIIAKQESWRSACQELWRLSWWNSHPLDHITSCRSSHFWCWQWGCALSNHCHSPPRGGPPTLLPLTLLPNSWRSTELRGSLRSPTQRKNQSGGVQERGGGAYIQKETKNQDSENKNRKN